MKRSIALLLLWLALPAQAHGPYSEKVGTFGALELHKSYVDGIFFVDPVRFEARERQGTVVAQTNYARDISILCTRDDRCLVFRYSDALTLVPEGWQFRGTGLERAESLWLDALGAVLPLWEHILGYGISFALFLIPFLVFRATSGTLLRVLAAVFGALILFVWILAAAAYSYLSLPLLALLILIAAGVAKLTVVKERPGEPNVNTA